MPHPLFEVVRTRYQRTCGYCGVTEVMVPAERNITHLGHVTPPVAGGRGADLRGSADRTLAALER